MKPSPDDLRAETRMNEHAIEIEEHPPYFWYTLKHGPYEVRMCLERGYFPVGPGSGFSYHGGTRWPHTNFEDRNAAEVSVACMNEAYAQGYAAAKREIRQALGLEKKV